MGLFTAIELRRIEREFADGISSNQVVEIFQERGERFSEPTLRKYVQLGLLPKSWRVGSRGRNRGSTGLYPVSVVRQINSIKRALEKGAMLEEIRLGLVGLSGEVDLLERTMAQVLRRFEETLAVEGEPRGQQPLKRTLERRRKALKREAQTLRTFALRVAEWHGRQVRP